MWFVFACLALVHPLSAIVFEEIQKVVSDPSHISWEEYKEIEECLRLVQEKDLPPMKTPRCRFFFKNFKLVGEDPSQTPVFEVVHVNAHPFDKRNCVVLYASYNSPYPENIYKIISALKAVQFSGHVLYRIGGFPNLENGSLKLIDVPYAFKACAMQEAALLGYKNILWIDSSLTPVKNLKPLFVHLEERGYFAMTSGSMIWPLYEQGWINQPAFSAMKLSKSDAMKTPHITMPIFGVNAHSAIGGEIIRSYYRMAEEGTSFFCDWPDEIPVSTILYHMKLKPSGIWHQYLIKDWEWNGKGTSHYFSMSGERPAGAN